MVTYLSVGPDDGAEQLPRPTSPVHPYHAQDLEEAEAAQCWRSKHLTTAAHQQDNNTGHDDEQVCNIVDWLTDWLIDWLIKWLIALLIYLFLFIDELSRNNENVPQVTQITICVTCSCMLLRIACHIVYW